MGVSRAQEASGDPRERLFESRLPSGSTPPILQLDPQGVEIEGHRTGAGASLVTPAGQRGGSLLSRSTPIAERSLRGLHPESIVDPAVIRELLERAGARRTPLHRGLNAQIDLETAFVEAVTERSLVLQTVNFDRRSIHGQLFLSFEDDDRPYFFATRRLALSDGDRLVVELPRTMFYRERRDRSRRIPDPAVGDPRRVELAGLGEGAFEGEIQDVSPSGLALLVPVDAAARRPGMLTVRYLDGRDRGREANLEVRSATPAAGRAGWTRLGLVRAEAAPEALIEVEYLDGFELADQSGAEPVLDRSPETRLEEPSVMRVGVPAAAGGSEELVCLVDRFGDPAGATAVVMLNGWGQTKEALLPLARTLVSTFRAHRQPIEVVRFDGIRKRGESFTDPECRVPGREAQTYVFSQGVRDIEALVRHLRESPEHGAARVIVISFSAAAIEVRKAVARDLGRNIDGWVSVVGSPDLQSMARSISGGVDYVGGHERGLSFGVQELLGVRVDIDRIAVDAVRHQMSFIEDSRRDLAAIDVPISWFHGRYDAWVDLGRVRDVLSHGDRSRRRLFVLPTGHQIKSSRQADQAFRLIAGEVARMALARNFEAVTPPARVVRHLRVAESRRLPRTDTDLQAFWRDYLVGRDRSLGIELLTAGSAYRAMMMLQLALLDVRSGDRIADLGSGTGAFALALARDACTPDGVEVIALDYVRDALDRARRRLDALPGGPRIGFHPLETDLDVVHHEQRIPLSDRSVDRVIASLLISYLESPELVLGEIHRIVRPGGRIVISSLCRDADISRLYVESFAELQAGSTGGDLPELRGADLGTVARNFLNDAARILELEDAGAFRFLDPDELSSLVTGAGFDDVRVERALGSPAQAVVLSARRPPA